MAIVTTIRPKCKRCYTCIRNCPAKAIKVVDGQAAVMPERCVACGSCVKVCAQQAKEIEDGIEPTRQLLQSGEHVIAGLAPSFPVAFEARPGQVVAALRRLGFAEVMEVAFGAQMLAQRYTELARQRSTASGPIITTACPALVTYVERYFPTLVPHLAPLVSPVVALGRAIKQSYHPGSRVVFVGPCVAKKAEIRDPNVSGVVDVALTFAELKRMLAQADIQPGDLPDRAFDGPSPQVARIFPVSGGLLKTAALRADVLENDILVTEGKDNCLRVLHELAEGRLEVKFLDLLFCVGCIDGPVIDSDLSLFERKERVAAYVRAQGARQTAAEGQRALAQYADVDLSRRFEDQSLSVALALPSESEVREVLRRINKFKKEDELNCGACGYPTCREKAIAVCQGLAEVQMCLPYLIDQLERNLRQLEMYQHELQSAQEQLIQTEKLASMGQLSAGIAHELNNPLSSILLYSHLLLKQVNKQDPRWDDLQTIVTETTRCKEIVAGLLDFARQRQVSLRPTEANALLEECIRLAEKRPGFENVRIRRQFADDLPIVPLDGAQMKQVFLNLLRNAAEAMPGGGDIVVSTAAGDSGRAVRLVFADSGCGIGEENLKKLFTPFFTTKPTGKGTGLGLAITYGVVKMHRGAIDVQSKVGTGTTFTITLPVSSLNGLKIGSETAGRDGS